MVFSMQTSVGAKSSVKVALPPAPGARRSLPPLPWAMKS
jgi:hypothetical protein